MEKLGQEAEVARAVSVMPCQPCKFAGRAAHVFLAWTGPLEQPRAFHAKGRHSAGNEIQQGCNRQENPCLKWAKPCKRAPILLSGRALAAAHEAGPHCKAESLALATAWGCLLPLILPMLGKALTGGHAACSCREGSSQREEIKAPRWILLWQQMKAAGLQNKELNFCM